MGARHHSTGLVTGGTGSAPVLPRMLRHGQMSVKDNLAASWMMQELPLLFQLHNLYFCHAQVHPFTCSVGPLCLSQVLSICFPTVLLCCLPVRLTVNGFLGRGSWRGGC